MLQFNAAPLRHVLFLVIVSLCASATRAGAEELRPLRLGIMPFNSTLALIRTHQPLRDHLSRSLGREVEIYTSPGYEAFLQDSLAGDFDLLVTGPHFGVMSLEAGYRPLYRYRVTLQPIFVIRPDSGIGSANALRGRRVALSNRLSISSTGGMRWLSEQGVPASEVTWLERTTHGAAIAAVAVGEADAALTTHTPLKQVPRDIRDQVTELPTSYRIPHLMTMVHQRLGQGTIERVREALASFGDSAAGQAFFRDTGYRGYEPISDTDIAALAPYVALVRELTGK